VLVGNLPWHSIQTEEVHFSGIEETKFNCCSMSDGLGTYFIGSGFATPCHV
jgi:hypothetical protein